MRRLIHTLGGNVRVQVECIYPERFMNLCAQNELSFWDLARVDAHTVEVSISLLHYKRLLPLLENIDAQVKKTHRAGVPMFFYRIRKRYALFVGALFALALVWGASLHVWDIQVQGNDTVPTVEILRALENAGVGIGSLGARIEPDFIRNDVLMALEDLSWITVNVNGSRATVIVRERVHPPARMEEGIPTAVYATQSGVIDQMIIWEGTPLVAVGDTVDIGQDLVSGRVESLAQGVEFLPAQASIYARTWYELSMTMPLTYYEKEFTGENASKSIIFLANRRINVFFDGGISYPRYDKMVSRRDFVLPGGIILPIGLERRTFLEYTLVEHTLDETRAALILQERLLEQLRQLIGETGEILRTHFEVELGVGKVSVHLRAECREHIAGVRRLTEEEMILEELPIQEVETQ